MSVLIISAGSVPISAHTSSIVPAFGGKGMIEYENEWLTPEEQKKRFEAHMNAEGRELFEGEYLTPAEIARRTGQRYINGEYVTEEQYQKIIAAIAAAVSNNTKPKPPTPKPPPRTLRMPRAVVYEDSSSRWLLDDFEEGHRWRSQTWKNANPCNLTTIEGTQTKRLRVTLSGGDQDKSAITRMLRLDLTSRAELLMDIENKCSASVTIAIAVQTDQYYESFTKILKPGLSRGVRFDLKSGDYKSAPNWTHRASITRPDLLKWITILVYRKESGKIVFDNIALVSGK